MNTKREYYIHIGPPKTATTSLQKYFISNEFKDITYEGIVQPRSKNDNSSCKNLYKKVVSDCDINSVSLVDLINTHSNSQIGFLSEEMFLVESPNQSWKEKIRRLHKLTTSIQPTILIVLREPISAIRSYYQEMYYNIDNTIIQSCNDFAKSSYCEIYRYDELVRFLRETGFEKIKMLEFNKLVAGHYSIGYIFNNSYSKKIKLPKKNISKKEGSNFYANNASIKKLLFKKTPSWVKKMFGDSLKRKVSSLIPDRKLSKGEQIDVEINDAIVSEFAKSYEIALQNKFF